MSSNGRGRQEKKKDLKRMVSGQFGFTNDLRDCRHPPTRFSLPISLQCHVTPLPSLPIYVNIFFFVQRETESEGGEGVEWVCAY